MRPMPRRGLHDLSKGKEERVKVYFASPLGFAASTEPFMREVLRALTDTGAEVINPWDSGFGPAFRQATAIADRDLRIAALGRVNTDVGRTNAESIQACDAVVAVLDGVDVDSGTVSEIGYAYALGKRIHGLRTDTRLIGDNEGSIVNLQVQYFIEASGGRVVRHLDDVVALLRAMTA